MLNKTKVLAVVAALALPGAGYGSGVGYSVVPLTDGTFEVLIPAERDPSETWCAAGDHALRYLDAARTSRVFLVRGVGPSTTTAGRNAVTFSLDQPADVVPVRGIFDPSNLFLTLRREGASLSVSHTQNLCPPNTRP
ncbi:hypothetical protein [Shimia biformata]|uniref:hypothetical protein n=1 Tax=Shimia biformata TaxID=1294299 RepID=UPI001951E186|nr:hypothetical protein [Shimia biformata]